MKEKKFSFFESYHRALDRVPDESYGRVVRGMAHFVFNGKEPVFTEDVDNVAWELIRPILEKGVELSHIRAEVGKKGAGISRNIGNKNAAKNNTEQNKNNTKQNKNNTKQSGIGIGISTNVDNKESTIVPKKDVSLSIEKRKENFLEEIRLNADDHPPEMLNEFFAYWTEKNPNGKKMRFEMEKTWETKKRLARWRRQY